MTDLDFSVPKELLVALNEKYRKDKLRFFAIESGLRPKLKRENVAECLKAFNEANPDTMFYPLYAEKYGVGFLSVAVLPQKRDNCLNIPYPIMQRDYSVRTNERGLRYNLGKNYDDGFFVKPVYL